MVKSTINQAGGSIMENKPLLIGLSVLALIIIYLIAAYFMCGLPTFFQKDECDESS